MNLIKSNLLTYFIIFFICCFSVELQAEQSDSVVISIQKPENNTDKLQSRLLQRKNSNNSTEFFHLEIDTALNINASVDYETRNGTAISGVDYTAVSGKAVIIAGEKSVDIPVNILKPNTGKTFSLVISNPVGGVFPSGVTEIIATHAIGTAPVITTPVVTPDPIISTKTPTIGVVQLGLIKGASVNITSLDNSIIYYTTSTNSEGIFEVDRDILKEVINRQSPIPKYIKVSTFGGVDIDPDDDGIVKVDEFKNVGGSVLGIISVKDLLNKSKVSINLITTAIAELLQHKEEVTDKDISIILKNINMGDINGDGKVDNSDAIEYDMVQHDSGAESKLRYQYLELIHDGDSKNRQNYVKSLQDDQSYVVREEQEINGNLSIVLKTLNDQNHIRYGIDVSPEEELPLVYQKGETISLSPKSSLYYEECRTDNTCYHREFTYYDGSKTTDYYPIPHIGSVYSDPEKISDLRLDYLLKRHYFLNPELFDGTNNENIRRVESEINELEIQIEKNREKIRNLGGIAISIKSISPSSASFNTSTTFTIEGEFLPPTLSVWIHQCKNLIFLERGDTQQKFTCIPSYSPGIKKLEIKDSTYGALLFSDNISVTSMENITTQSISKNFNSFPDALKVYLNNNRDYWDKVDDSDHLKFFDFDKNIPENKAILEYVFNFETLVKDRNKYISATYALYYAKLLATTYVDSLRPYIPDGIEVDLDKISQNSAESIKAYKDGKITGYTLTYVISAQTGKFLVTAHPYHIGYSESINMGIDFLNIDEHLEDFIVRIVGDNDLGHQAIDAIKDGEEAWRVYKASHYEQATLLETTLSLPDLFIKTKTSKNNFDTEKSKSSNYKKGKKLPVVTVEEANKYHTDKGHKAPYSTKYGIIDFVADGKTTYVRFFNPDDEEYASKKRGSWMTKVEDVEGLKAEQIADLLALPNVPTKMTYITPPKDWIMRRSTAAPNNFGNGEKNGGGIQYEAASYLNNDKYISDKYYTEEKKFKVSK
jgi:hypothetical protein